jgi:hypothetical protein
MFTGAILSQMNSTHTFLHYFSKIHANIIFSSICQEFSEETVFLKFHGIKIMYIIILCTVDKYVCNWRHFIFKTISLVLHVARYTALIPSL